MAVSLATDLRNAFRIPMRGYESFLRSSVCALIWVPNPHEGL